MGRKDPFYVDIMATHPEVTGTCIPLSVRLASGRRFMIVLDCGMFQEHLYDEYNEDLPFNPENVEVCLVSHNHIDHTGRLPLLIKKGYKNRVYTTKDTATLLSPALEDNLAIISDFAKRKNKKPMYSNTDVETLMHLIKPCEFEDTIRVHENVKATFFENGHLPGAAIILLQISCEAEEDINILFTGDYSPKNIFFAVAALPKWVRELPLTIITESTYGTTNTTDMVKCFKENVADCIKNGGTVVAPVFSLDRSQKVAYEIKLMQQMRMLPTNIPVYFDGKLARKYTDIYQNGRINISENMRDFLPENCTMVDSSIREAVLRDTNQKIILTTSGMGSHGPAQMYIPEYIRRKNAMIHFTGYTTVGSIGHKLKSTSDGDKVEAFGMVLKKVARVEYTSEYSAHAKADEMIEFLNQFTNLRLVLVTHGNTDTKQSFASKVLDEVDTKNVGILGRDYLFRVNHYGFVKSMTTKFM